MKTCTTCDYSTVLQHGASKGASWCFIRSHVVVPLSVCFGFEENRTMEVPPPYDSRGTRISSDTKQEIQG